MNITIEEAVYRGWNIHHPIGYGLWLWHEMMGEYGYGVSGVAADPTASIAERGAGPWDKIILSEHIWIS